MAKRERWYVTMMWDDYPEGGSFGTIVMANGYEQAEAKCRKEMAAHRVRESDDYTIASVIRDYADYWELVDCYPLDGFIRMHMTDNLLMAIVKERLAVPTYTPEVTDG
jgi:hypothetical protein